MSRSDKKAGFRKIECLIVVFASLLLAAPASAELLCAEPILEVPYDGCLLPNDPNQENPWIIAPGSDGAPYIDNCQLIISVLGSLEYFGYRRYDEALETAESFSMEARMKVEDFYLHGNWADATLGISDGLKYAYIYIHHRSDGTMFVSACGQDQLCGSVFIDSSIYHNYRIEVWKEGTAKFFLDGEMFHEVEYNMLMDSITPHVSLFAGAESVSYWNFVNYEVCSDALPPMPVLLPLEEQVAVIKAEVDILAIKMDIKDALKEKLDDALLADQYKQSAKFYNAGRFLFQKKFSGAISANVYTKIVETLIDFAQETTTIVPFTKNSSRWNGYKGRLEIDFGEVLNEENLVHFTLKGRVSPTGRHSSGKSSYGLVATLTIYNLLTGELIRNTSNQYILPEKLPANKFHNFGYVDYYWDLLREDGSSAIPELYKDGVFFSATLDYVEIDKGTFPFTFIGYVDSASFAVRTMGVPNTHGILFMCRYDCERRCRYLYRTLCNRYCQQLWYHTPYMLDLCIKACAWEWMECQLLCNILCWR